MFLTFDILKKTFDGMVVKKDMDCKDAWCGGCRE